MSEMVDWLWSHVDKSGGPDGCWRWAGFRNRNGYGVARGHLVHRVTLALSLGRPLRDGMWSLHHCDNPSCVNPAHLYEGTHADNTRDAKNRGRYDKVSSEQRAHIHALRGYVIEDVAAWVQCSRFTVARVMQERGPIPYTRRPLFPTIDTGRRLRGKRYAA